MNTGKYRFVVLSLVVLLSACSAKWAGTYNDRAMIGSGFTTSTHRELVNLPPPEQKIPVAVYKFRDQTGQYKYSSSVSSFSTAVTQGATSMLIKALEDSGWFIPIEREGLSNLLSERKIIRQTREGYATEEQKKKNSVEALPPLLFASVLLEGGIISYDTNLVTSGFGLKYFGTGGSGQVRSDQLSIYLRAVTINNGAVLKSVQTSKTVISREVDLGVYQFVSYKKLLQAEMGLSTNEPVQMCVLEAVEKAVHDLVLEAVLSGTWKLQNPEDIKSPAILKYLKEKEAVEVRLDKQGHIISAVTPSLASGPSATNKPAGDEVAKNKAIRDQIAKLYALAEAHMKDKKYDLAISDWKNILELDAAQEAASQKITAAMREKMSAEYAEAKRAYEGGNYTAALDHYTVIRNDNPSDNDAAAAVEKLNDIIKISPRIEEADQAGAMMRKALAQYVDANGSRRASMAAAWYAYQLQQNAHTTAVKNLLESRYASILNTMVMPVEGMKLVNQYLLAALQHFYEGRYDLSIQACMDALELQPDNVLALKRLGSAYVNGLKNKDKAREAWERALKIAPDDKELKEFIRQLK